MASETQLIERVRRRFPVEGKGLGVGIGDDAAVLRPYAGKEWIVTTDAFLENVHFLRKIHPPDAVGFKALARATSDIAAMGARPRFFFITMGLPDTLADSAWLGGFLGGMARASRKFGLALAGGDTTKYPSVVISLTVMGEAARGKAVLRSGAKPGDLLCVSGKLGQAELGLRLIRKKLHNRENWSGLLRKHYYPEPRLVLGEWLASRRFTTSMVDTSDGLSTDLSHICKASGVGAVVRAQRLPVVTIPPALHRLHLDPLDLALHGGEDYELLFTVSRRAARRLPSAVRGVPVTVIGEITRKRQLLLIRRDGSTTRLQPGGWDPFK